MEFTSFYSERLGKVSGISVRKETQVDPVPKGGNFLVKLSQQFCTSLKV